MTIKITLEFATADLAIVALAKINAPLNKKEAVAVPEGVVVPSGRKGRNDKGKPRGSYKNPPATTAEPQTPVPPGSSVPDAVSPSPQSGAPAAPEVAASAVVSPVAAAPVASDPAPTAEQAQKAMEVLFAAKGLEVCLDTLKAFGVKRVGELKADDRAAFIARTKEALA